MDHQNGTYFGIDLGTTNTVVSKGNVLFNGLIQSQIVSQSVSKLILLKCICNILQIIELLS